MPFEEIVGQERVVGILRRAIAGGNLPHAYLFHGSDGLGRFKTAVALAKALLCNHSEGDFCGSCSSCKRIDSGTHPDVLIIGPESRTQGGQWVPDPEMGTIRIQQIRELEHWIALRSFEGPWKMGILVEAHRMNLSAANALLKTLEEPPSSSLLVLVSPTRSGLLPTIVSRCQPLYFSPLSRNALERFLLTRSALEEEWVPVVAALAEGSPGRALRLDLDWVKEERRVWMERLHAFLGSGGRSSLISFAEVLVRSDHLLEILDVYESWYRDVLACRVGVPGSVRNRDWMERILREADESDPMESVSRIESIRRARQDLVGSNNLNQQLVIEGLLLRLLDPDPGTWNRLRG